MQNEMIETANRKLLKNQIDWKRAHQHLEAIFPVVNKDLLDVINQSTNEGVVIAPPELCVYPSRIEVNIESYSKYMYQKACESLGERIGVVAEKHDLNASRVREDGKRSYSGPTYSSKYVLKPIFDNFPLTH